MQTTVYGIPNCDTVKKARAWLTARGIEHAFHDFKQQGVPAAPLERWMVSVGWEVLLNRKGTTWRHLDAARQAAVVDGTTAARLMCEQPSVIKRPVIEWPDGAVTVGFQPEAFELRA